MGKIRKKLSPKKKEMISFLHFIKGLHQIKEERSSCAKAWAQWEGSTSKLYQDKTIQSYGRTNSLKPLRELNATIFSIKASLTMKTNFSITLTLFGISQQLLCKVDMTLFAPFKLLGNFTKNGTKQIFTL